MNSARAKELMLHEAEKYWRKLKQHALTSAQQAVRQIPLPVDHQEEFVQSVLTMVQRNMREFIPEIADDLCATVDGGTIRIGLKMHPRLVRPMALRR